MSQEGDAPKGQPAEGVVTLDSLAAKLDISNEAAPVESEEGEESGEAEEVEAEEGSEEQPEEQPEEEAEEPTFTIKVDGKEVTLKQSELLEQAQKGFDYTKKTMAVAEERKAVEAVKAEVEQYRQQSEYVLNESLSRLNAVVSVMQEELGEPPPIEWAQQDAATYLAHKELYESRKGKLERAQHAFQQMQQEQARQRHAWVLQQAEETEKALRDTLPGWNQEKLEALNAYVGGLGLTPQSAELAFLKPGFWQLADKAKAYDALMAKKAELKPVSQLPKVHKPTANNQPPQLAKRQEAMKRHKAKPSIDSLADLL